MKGPSSAPIEKTDRPTQPVEDEVTGEKKYTISFAPKAELFKHANEPLLIVRELKTLRRRDQQRPFSNGFHSFKNLDGEEAYIAWNFTLWFQTASLNGC